MANWQGGEWKDTLSQWWSSRAPQERTTLKIALPIIGLLLLYILLIEPLMNTYFSTKAEYKQAEGTLTWLYEQSNLVSRMQNSCGNRVISLQPGETPVVLVRNIARRSSLNADYSEQGDTINISIANAPGNRVLAFMQSLVCNGYEISNIELNRVADESSQIRASLSAVPMAIPRAQSSAAQSGAL